MTKNRPEKTVVTEEGQGGPDAALPLLPTRGLVLFPKMVAPIFVGREKSISAIEAAYGAQSALILCAQREAAVEDPSFDDLRPIGVRARVLQLFKLPDGSVKALVEGDERVRAERAGRAEPHFVVEYAPLESADRASARARSLARRVADEFVRYVQLHPQLADEAQFALQQADGPDELADIVAAHLQTEPDEKQALLEIVSTQQRLLALLESLAEENAVLGIEQEIGLQGAAAHRGRAAPAAAAREAARAARRDRGGRRERRRGHRRLLHARWPTPTSRRRRASSSPGSSPSSSRRRP